MSVSAVSGETHSLENLVALLYHRANSSATSLSTELRENNTCTYSCTLNEGESFRKRIIQLFQSILLLNIKQCLYHKVQASEAEGT